MWLFLPTGFLSAVVHRDDPTRILVRAREAAPLVALLDALDLTGRVEIEASPRADYPLRVLISRAEWSRFLVIEAGRMAATNFKSEAHRERGYDRYTGALHTIWRVVREAFEPLPSNRIVAHGATLRSLSEDPPPWAWDDGGVEVAPRPRTIRRPR